MAATIDYIRSTLRLEALTPVQREAELRQFVRRIRVFHYTSPGEQLAPHGGGLSIKVVVHGQEWFHLPTGPVTLCSGEALLVPAGLCYGSAITRPTETFSAFFPEQFAGELAGAALGRPLERTHPRSADRLGPVPIRPERALRMLLDGARHALQAGALERAEEMLQLGAEHLVLTAAELRQADEQLRMVRRRPAGRRELLRRLQRVRAWLHDHIEGACPLEQLAAVGDLSRFHLLRAFRDAFGCTPAQYHAELKLRRARERVAASAEPVAAIALALGWRSPSAFTRAWRNRFGDLPRELRGARPEDPCSS